MSSHLSVRKLFRLITKPVNFMNYCPVAGNLPDNRYFFSEKQIALAAEQSIFLVF